jgi:hypothetical protein
LGLRPASERGVFETGVSTPGDLDRCFSRITGKDPDIKARRKKAYDQVKGVLATKCPQLFERNYSAVKQEVREELLNDGMPLTEG